MNADGDDNVQINAEGDVVSASGEGAIAAGGDITIQQGIDPKIHAQALMEIEMLKKKIQEFKDSSNQKDEKKHLKKSLILQPDLKIWSMSNIL